MRAVLAYAVARLRVRRGRVLLAAGGIVAAGAMLGASVTVAYGLATGFDRTASRAQTPDIVATFQPESRDAVARVVSSLANVRTASACSLARPTQSSSTWWPRPTPRGPATCYRSSTALPCTRPSRPATTTYAPS